MSPIFACAQTHETSSFQSLLQRGFDLHQRADFAAAIPVFEQARKLEPQDYFVNLLLGIDLLRTGKASEAVARLQLAARIKPGEEFPEDYLGEAEATLGHEAAAAEAFEQGLRRGHNSELGLEAWAGFALERFREIGEQLRASSQGVEVARRLQKTALSSTAQTSGCAASIPLLERKLYNSSKHIAAETAYQLSRCYALAAGDAALQLQSGAEDMAAVHRLRGDVLLRLKGDASAAEAEYSQGLVLHPDDPALLERLAEAQLSTGDAEAARGSAKAALTIDPHRREALRTLAALEMNNRNYELALPYLRQLLSESPGDLSVQVELGRALAQSDQPAEALRLLQPALVAGYPDEKGSLHALTARVLHRLGKDDDAEKAEAEARRLSNAYQARGALGDTSHDVSPDAIHERPELE
jgi:predicted Zn-dependent protease